MCAVPAESDADLLRPSHGFPVWRAACSNTRQLVAPLFVAAVFGGALLAPFSAVLRAVWLLTYAVDNLFFSRRTAARYGMEHLPRLPLVFLTIHFAWGLGFWRGILKR